MSRIDCDASACVHNREGCCNAAVIHVRGGTSTSADRVRCGTYAFIRPAPHTKDGFLFEAGADMSPPLEKGETVRVACSACRCVHFNDYMCTLDELKVTDPSYSDNRARCASFQPE